MKQKRGKKLLAFLTSVCVFAGSAYGHNVVSALEDMKYASVSMQEAGIEGTNSVYSSTTENVIVTEEQNIVTTTGDSCVTTEIVTEKPQNATTAVQATTTQQLKNTQKNSKIVVIDSIQYSSKEVTAGSTLKITAQGTVDYANVKDSKVEFTFMSSDESKIKAELIYNVNTKCLEGEVKISEDVTKGIYSLKYIMFTDSSTGITCQYAIADGLLDTFEKTDQTQQNAAIEKISLSAQTLNMKENSSKKITAMLVPENSTEELIFTSSDSSVASVTQDGYVTAQKEGTATITVAAKNNPSIIAKCKIVVADNLVIVLDPGHGNKDVGAVNRSQGLYERDVNLEIAKACRDYLEQYEGVTVFLTRETNSQFLGLEERTKFAKACDADVFISLHNNASISKKMTGSEVWVTRSTYKAKYHKAMKSLGNKILTQIDKVGIKKRGVYTRKSSYLKYSFDGSRADYYAVIRGSIEKDIPAMIVEHGYIDSSDYRFMNSKAKTKKLGVADAKAIVKHYGLTKRTDTENAIEVGGIKLNCNDSVLTIKKNASYKLKATIAPYNAQDKGVTYSSSNTKIVSVAGSGKLKAKKKGSATITCKAKDAGGATKKLKVTVK